MIITLKWIYKAKLDKYGDALKNKARLVAKGYQQEEDTRSAYACNDAMNVSCNSRLYASYDVNVLFAFDDAIIRNSQGSKTPFRKKPRDSLNFALAIDFAVIAGYGDVVIRSMTNKKVYYVEGFFVSILVVASASFSPKFRHNNNLMKNNLVRGLPKIKFEKDHLCSACKQEKIHRKYHKSKTTFASNKPLYLLHMDLCGLMYVESINGKRYVLVVVDDYSWYTWVSFLHSKDEASEVIISFIKKTQVNLQLQVQRVRTDNGTEFKNKTLAKFFDEVGITQQISAARTPQQNGVVKRRNRTLVETARTMLTFANLPLFVWAEAITTACFTPKSCYLFNDYDDVGKLKAKGDIEVFIGYSKQSAAFRVYNKRTRKIHESVNVNFDEISEMASK
nr:retrovirus-related Pol polyprotein from transposon TNT 1-94 [Tanacetum cinerariifolium]